jgi:hypothetical protein
MSLPAGRSLALMLRAPKHFLDCRNDIRLTARSNVTLGRQRRTDLAVRHTIGVHLLCERDSFGP